MKKRVPFCTVGRMQIGAATVESSMEFPQKIKNGTALRPSNSTSGYISEETQNNIERIDHPVFTAALFTTAKICKQPKRQSGDEWIKKAVVRLHDGVLLSHKRRKSYQKDLEGIMLSEISY